MTNKLDELRAMTTVVADTGDMDSIRAFKPTELDHQPVADPQGFADASLRAVRG